MANCSSLAPNQRYDFSDESESWALKWIPVNYGWSDWPTQRSCWWPSSDGDEWWMHCDGGGKLSLIVHLEIEIYEICESFAASKHLSDVFARVEFSEVCWNLQTLPALFGQWNFAKFSITCTSWRASHLKLSRISFGAATTSQLSVAGRRGAFRWFRLACWTTHATSTQLLIWSYYAASGTFIHFGNNNNNDNSNNSPLSSLAPSWQAVQIHLLDEAQAKAATLMLLLPSEMETNYWPIIKQYIITIPAGFVQPATRG